MILRFLLFCLLFLSMPYLLKPPFKVPRQIPLPSPPEWEIALSPEIEEILKQPFTYLNRGNQSTVFESQDKKYVLKLFRYTRPRFPLIHSLKSQIAKFKSKKPKDDLFTKTNETLNAAFIAYTEGRAFTQVVYCHLNLTENQLPTAQLKTFRTYRLPLDRYRFVLQKKVIPFKEMLLSARNDPEQMHALIDSFINLLHARAAAGIRNSDPNLGPNFGFLDGQAVELDFGNYRKPPYDPAQRAIEIASYLTRLKHWLEKNAPEYVAYVCAKNSFCV